MLDRIRATRAAALLQLSTAAGIVAFWTAFYAQLLFEHHELERLIENFRGYWAWETAFTLPDLLLACASTAGGVMLLRDPESKSGRTLLSAASGALLFLGVLDANYALRNGLYRLDHPFMKVLGVVAFSVVGSAALTLFFLHAGAGQAERRGMVANVRKSSVLNGPAIR